MIIAIEIDDDNILPVFWMLLCNKAALSNQVEGFGVPIVSIFDVSDWILSSLMDMKGANAGSGPISHLFLPIPICSVFLRLGISWPNRFSETVPCISGLPNTE